MTSISGSPGIAQQVWQRFVKAADQDGDQKLSGQELKAFSVDGIDDGTVERLLQTFDADGDGAIAAQEILANPYQPQETPAPLDIADIASLSREERDAMSREDVASLFERADVDGDGLLSKEEWQAERAMAQSRYLDSANEPAGVVYAIHKNGDWDYLSPEDVSAGRRLTGLKLVAPEDMPPEMRERMEEVREMSKKITSDPDYKAPPTAEQREAAIRNNVLNTPLAGAFGSRLLAQLVASLDAAATETG